LNILILGMDGYIGWALAQKQLYLGNKVFGIDNFSRRKNVQEMISDSAIPIEKMEKRISKIKEVYGERIEFYEGDLTDSNFTNDIIKKSSPDAIVHLAEQPSAPYSMIDQNHCIYTHQNNVIGNLNLIYSMKNHAPKSHLIKLGTMGEYGYDPGFDIPEGFFEIEYRGKKATVPYPKMAGSWYHWTKVHDSNNIMFACKVWGLKSTDIMQGIVYGTRIKDIPSHIYQPTRFDFDEAFGTVVNRYCAQATIGHKLTVYGKGGQTRGFLALEDSIQCISLLIEKPPENEDYRVVNQFDEQYDITNLANRVKRIGNSKGLEIEIENIENPRAEKEIHYYKADHDKLRDLGFKATRSIDDEIGYILEDLLPHRDRIMKYKDAIVKQIKWRTGEKVLPLLNELKHV
jgi:nucleoside-diphosphate-sugar epimerase